MGAEYVESIALILSEPTVVVPVGGQKSDQALQIDFCPPQLIAKAIRAETGTRAESVLAPNGTRLHRPVVRFGRVMSYMSCARVRSARSPQGA
jgi:hypothetical protein